MSAAVFKTVRAPYAWGWMVRLHPSSATASTAPMLKPAKIALGLALAATALGISAIMARSLPAAALLGWTAIACALTAWAYATNQPAIHGKRAGRLGWRSLATLPFLACYRLACPLLHAIHHHNERLTHIGSGIHVGGRLLPADLPEGKPAILDLTAEVNEHPEIRCLPGYRQLAALDGHLPRDEDLLATLRSLARVTAPVVIHCESGRGRAPTVAAALLMMRGMAFSIEEALERVGARRIIAPTRSDRLALERLMPRLLVARPESHTERSAERGGAVA